VGIEHSARGRVRLREAAMRLTQAAGLVPGQSSSALRMSGSSFENDGYEAVLSYYR